MDWMARIREIDDWIRQGRGAVARGGLSDLTRRHKVPRELLAEVARLAWRAEAPSLGLRLLNPLVRPKSRAPARASDDETAEYAACLIKIGAVAEASRLLETLDFRKTPKALLYEAFARTVCWDYEGVVPLLLRYLETPRLGSYEKLVARVNLAAAYVFLGRRREATFVFRELLYETSLRRYGLLHGNCLELATENFVMQGKWKQAEKCIAQARTDLAGTNAVYALLARKWQGILTFMKSRCKNRLALDEVRSEAGKLGHWETLRECDRFEAVGVRNEKLFRHLYYGTPQSGFRWRLERDWGSAPPIGEHYDWALGPAGGEGHRGIDVQSGTVEKARTPLKAGKLAHRLLRVLSSDFYRPFRLGALYSALFPGEHFNPTTSPRRVHQAVAILRKWFAQCRLPLAIEEVGGAYRLTAVAPCRLRLVRALLAERSESAGDFDGLRLMLLERAQKEGKLPAEFSSSSAAAVLRSSERSARRLLGAAVEAGRLVRTGSRRGARYAFVVLDGHVPLRQSA